MVKSIGHAVQERDARRQMPLAGALDSVDVFAGFCFRVLQTRPAGPPTVYVNIAHSPGMPECQIGKDEDLAAVFDDPNGAMRLPMLVGEMRSDTEGGGAVFSCGW